MSGFFIINNGFYWVHFGDPHGSEQAFDRPAIVVRTTKESPVCTVLPLTLERLGDNIPYHIDLECTESTVLVEQIRTIDKTRIYGVLKKDNHFVNISSNDWTEINRQLETLYRLKNLRKAVDRPVAI